MNACSSLAWPRPALARGDRRPQNSSSPTRNDGAPEDAARLRLGRLPLETIREVGLLDAEKIFWESRCKLCRMGPSACRSEMSAARRELRPRQTARVKGAIQPSSLPTSASRAASRLFCGNLCGSGEAEAPLGGAGARYRAPCCGPWRIKIEGRRGPALGVEDRPEQERLPGDLHAGGRGQRLDAHGREVGIGGGEVVPELEPGAWHRSISRLFTVARSQPAERLKHSFTY
mgnify:CR=1 FL=1